MITIAYNLVESNLYFNKKKFESFTLLKHFIHTIRYVNFFQVPIPCRPQKTFTVFVLEIPEDIPEEDIRHSLYKFQSVVEVTRLPKDSGAGTSGTGSAATEKSSAVNPGSGKVKVEFLL
jgi:hypothetical protein